MDRYRRTKVTLNPTASEIVVMVTVEGWHGRECLRERLVVRRGPLDLVENTDRLGRFVAAVFREALQDVDDLF